MVAAAGELVERGRRILRRRNVYRSLASVSTFVKFRCLVCTLLALVPTV